MNEIRNIQVEVLEDCYVFKSGHITICRKDLSEDKDLLYDTFKAKEVFDFNASSVLVGFTKDWMDDKGESHCKHFLMSDINSMIGQKYIKVTHINLEN